MGPALLVVIVEKAELVIPRWYYKEKFGVGMTVLIPGHRYEEKVLALILMAGVMLLDTRVGRQILQPQ